MAGNTTNISIRMDADLKAQADAQFTEKVRIPKWKNTPNTFLSAIVLSLRLFLKNHPDLPVRRRLPILMEADMPTVQVLS